MNIHSFRIYLVVIGAFLLSGCHKLETTTRIEPNGSGELQMGVGFSAEERANLEKQNPNQQDFCNKSQTSPKVTIMEQARGDETWCITTTQFKNLEELRNLYEQRKGLTINKLEITDGRLYYDIDMDTSSKDSSFSALTDITWTVELPGAPLTHNANKTEGNTLTWKPAPKSGIVNLHVESEAPQSGFIFLLLGILLLIAGVVFLRFRRRQQLTK